MPNVTKSGHRPIHKIAEDIQANWQNVNYGAKPYIEAMHSLDDITDRYGLEDAVMIVCYFLNNATGWRGDHARRIKAELKALPGVSR